MEFRVAMSNAKPVVQKMRRLVPSQCFLEKKDLQGLLQQQPRKEPEVLLAQDLLQPEVSNISKDYENEMRRREK